MTIFRGELAVFNRPGFFRDYKELQEKLKLNYDCYEKYKKSAPCDKINSDYLAWEESFSRNYIFSENDLKAKEWIERRRAEGGDALVRAWIEIGEDFLNSL